MVVSYILKRAGAVAVVALTLTAAAAPQAAYARHGSGAAIALGVLGGLALGTAISQGRPGYAPAPAHYYSPPPYYPVYYGAVPGYYTGGPGYAPTPYGYAAYGEQD